MKFPKGLHPSVLLILDGFGIAPAGPWNAIAQAKAPTIHNLLGGKAVLGKLLTHGEAVGLPEGVMGNSEVGHMSIGSGRVVWQELSRINKDIRDGGFQRQPKLLEALHKARDTGRTLHLMGLLSDGGVHAHEDHWIALLELCKKEGVKKVALHPFLDGRDTPPSSAGIYLEKLEKKAKALGVGQVATVSGRFYSMDRDKRWERTQAAYEMLWGSPTVAHAPSAEKALADSYGAGVTDEFVKPVIIKPELCLHDGDVVIFMNYRADRMRQIVAALGEEHFDGFTRRADKVNVYCMTQYDEHFSLPVIYPPNSLSHLLGNVIADAGLKQFRIAETEKYAHVTFFFNGGKEDMLPGEERILIPSPRDVPTYDLKPAMSALEVTKKLLEAVRRKEFAFLVCNFANADMVGHTGVFAAAINAVETLDRCVAEIKKACEECGYELFISADHGNVEEMRDTTGESHTQHTLNPVPLIYLPADGKNHFKMENGSLADIMPTILNTMHLPIPKEVTGHNLLVDTKKKG